MRDRWQDDAELAGITDVQGLLAARLPESSGLWRPTAVRLETGHLFFEAPEDYWKRHIADWGWQQVEAPADFLDRFVAIERAEQALDFAQRYGPLFLCSEHFELSGCLWRPSADESPQIHMQVRGLVRLLRGPHHPPSPHGCRWDRMEPVVDWLTLARQVRATLHIASLCRTGRPLPPTVWRDFDPWGLIGNTPPAERIGLVVLMSALINSYLTEEPGGPRVEMTEDLRLTVNPGLGALRAVWLLAAQAISRERAIFVCAGCGKLHTRPVDTRVPKTGERSYCPQCRETYRPAKKLSNAKRRRQLRTLLGFVNERRGQDWPAILSEWNAAYPEWRYEDPVVIREDFEIRSITYGVRKGG